MVILRRLLTVLVVVILGSIAAQELLTTIGRLAPILIVLGLALFIGGGWLQHKRKF